MATLADLVEGARRLLTPFSTDRRNALNTSLDASTTTVVLSTITNSVPSVGDYIGIEYEVMYVSAVSQGTTTATLTVSRAEQGTTAAAHASGGVVEVTPRFARGLILQALRDEIRSWPYDLYSTHTQVVEFAAGTATADLLPDAPTEVYSVLAAHRVSEAWDSRVKDPIIDIKRGFTAAATPDGYILQLRDARYDSAGSVHVTYSQAFDTETAWASTTDLANIGLSPSMYDIPPLGVAWRMLAGRDAERADFDAFDQSRKAAEVPATYPRQAAEGFRRDRDLRIQQEANRLRDLWGVRSG